MSRQSSKLSSNNWSGLYSSQQVDQEFLNGFPNSFYYIKDIIKQRHYKGRLQFFVSWQGWPSKYNSWVYGETVMPVEQLMRANESTQPTNIGSQSNKEIIIEDDLRHKIEYQITEADVGAKRHQNTGSIKIIQNNNSKLNQSKNKYRNSQNKSNRNKSLVKQNGNYIVSPSHIQKDKEINQRYDEYTSHIYQKYQSYQKQKNQKAKNKKQRKKRAKKDIKQAKKINLFKKTSQNINLDLSISSQDQQKNKKKSKYNLFQTIKNKNSSQNSINKYESSKQNSKEAILKQKITQKTVNGLNMSPCQASNIPNSSSFIISNIINPKNSLLSIGPKDLSSKDKQINKNDKKLKEIIQLKQKAVQNKPQKGQNRVENIILDTNIGIINNNSSKHDNNKKVLAQNPMKNTKPQNVSINSLKNKQFMINIGEISEEDQLSKMSFDSLNDYSMISQTQRPNMNKNHTKPDLKINKFFTKKLNKIKGIPLQQNITTDNNILSQIKRQIKQQNVNKTQKLPQMPIQGKKQEENIPIIQLLHPKQYVIHQVVKNEQKNQQKQSNINSSFMTNQSLLLPVNPLYQNPSINSKINKNIYNNNLRLNLTQNNCLSRISDTNLLQFSIQNSNVLLNFPIQPQLTINPLKKQPQQPGQSRNILQIMIPILDKKQQQDNKMSDNKILNTSINNQTSMLMNITLQNNPNINKINYINQNQNDNKNNQIQYSMLLQQQQSQDNIQPQIPTPNPINHPVEYKPPLKMQQQSQKQSNISQSKQLNHHTISSKNKYTVGKQKSKQKQKQKQKNDKISNQNQQNKNILYRNMYQDLYYNLNIAHLQDKSSNTQSNILQCSFDQNSKQKHHKNGQNTPNIILNNQNIDQITYQFKQQQQIIRNMNNIPSSNIYDQLSPSYSDQSSCESIRNTRNKPI